MEGLAFCLYGEFNWPPTPDESLRTEKTATGCVAIGFDAGYPDYPDHWVAWMMWLPEGKFSESDALETITPPSSTDGNVYQLGDDFSQLQKDKIFRVWLHDPGDSKSKHEILAFRGAFLLDCYSAAESKNPYFRSPLVRQFNHLKTPGFYSQLLIGPPDKQEFRFDIGIPSPIQQTNRKDWANEAVFPLGAVYESCPKKVVKGRDRDPRTIRSIFLGTNKRNHNDKLKDVPPNEERQLGQFGFTVTNPEKRNGFATLKKLEGNYFKWSRYFPVGEGFESRPPIAVLGHLIKLGFSFTSTEEKYSFLKVVKRADADPDNLMLSFLSDEDKTHSGIVVRIRQRFKENAKHQNDEKDDITFEKDDYTSAPKSIRLKFGPEIRKKVDTNSISILTECTVKWSKDDIPPATIFKSWHDKSLSKLLQPKATAWLQWEQDVDSSIGKGYITDNDPDEKENYALLDNAIRSMRAVRLSLQQTEGAQPQSFFPEWQLTKKAKNVRFAAYPQNLVASFQQDGLIEWENVYNLDDAGLRFRLSLAECPKAERQKGNQNGYQISLRTRLPSMGEKVPASEDHARVLLTHDRLAADASVGDTNFASFRMDNDGAGSPGAGGAAIIHRYRLGALSFERKKGPLATEKDSTNYSRLGVSRGPDSEETIGDQAIAVAAPLSIDLHLRLAVDQVLPTTVDLPRGSRVGRPAPLLITDQSQQAVDKDSANFILDVREKTTVRGDWHLKADLFDGTDRSGGTDDCKRSFVVVSEQPFSLLRFSRESFGGQGDAESALVAAYDSISRTWQFRNKGSYRYTAQAQSVGEGADKPRRLEIHDPARDDTSHRPYPLDKSGEPRSDASYVVDYRLTPPADVWIDPTDVERSFVLPEWSAHEIFRQRGAFGLGVGLQGLRAEFLYGLSVGIDTEKETGPAQVARIAEIEALTGEILDVDATDSPYKPLDSRWKAVQKALRSRPERLEVWTLNAANERPFAASRFTDGTAFALRSTALHRPPISAPGDPGATSLPVQPRRGSPRYHEQGLPGGALWPLESRNFFDRLLEAPDSVGGTVERVALSPFGGDADQTAGFLGGNLRVISQTRNGRVQRQRVDIMGRIAALWHRAKHVVVYERTVNASPQFAPDIDAIDPDRHKTRTRRPILRKVSEYVELLEPYRNYPDVEGIAAKTTGFLDSVRFNAKTINVDSAWSEDVDKDGWKIPLWNRYAARRRPKVYPRPDIGFTTVAEGEGERPLVTQECLDPENLFFFAEASTNPDTDSWLSRVGVDYANVADAGDVLGIINDINDETNPQKADQYDSPRARNASRILPGYRRFTWRLAPAGVKSRLNAERGERPIYAGLESVTFMRVGLMPGAPGAKDIRELLKASLQLDRSLGTKAPPLWTPNEFPVEVEDERSAFKAIVEAVKEAKDTHNADDAIRKYETWRNDHILGGETPIVDKIFPKGKDGEVYNYLKGLEGKYTDLLDNGQNIEKEIKEKLEDSGSRCESLQSEAVGEIRLKRRLIAEEMREFRAALDRSTFPDKSKAGLIDDWVEELQKRLDKLLDPAQRDLGNARAGIETIRAAIDDVEMDIETALRKARRRVDAMLASYDAAKPWSDARMDELFAKLSREFNGLWDDIYAAIDEARQRFATELDDTAQRIGAAAARLIQDIAEAKFVSLARLNGASASVRGVLGKVDSAVVKAEEGLKKAKRAIEKAKRKNDRPIYADALSAIATASTTVAATNDLIDSIAMRQAGITKTLRATITDIADTATAFNDDVSAALIDITAVLDKLVEDGFHVVADELRQFKAELQSALDGFKEWATNTATAAIEYVKGIIQPLRDWLDEEFRAAIKQASMLNEEVMSDLDGIAAQVQGQIAALQAALGGSPSEVAQMVGRIVFRPSLEYVLSSITDADLKDAAIGKQRVIDALGDLADEVEERVAELADGALGTVNDLGEICHSLSSGVMEIRNYIEREIDDYRKKLKEEIYSNASLARLEAAIRAVSDNVEDIQKALRELGYLDAKVTSLYNDAVSTAEYGRAYADRVLDQAGKLTDDGLGATPNNILRLYSAATSSPELAMLQTNIDRLRTTYREAEDFLRSSKAKALLGRLGDALKAMGLDLPFDKLGDQFRINNDDIKGLKLSEMFRNFGGIKLNGLFEDVKLSDDVQQFIDKYIKVSHDFDRKAARAWVQVDVDVPVRGTRTLFEVGPFKANLKNSILKGRLRLEASKDTERVQESGNALVATQIEMAVSGQTMVMLEKVALRFSKESGMDFAFDPKRIKLNPAFQFIQDTLGQIFPDELGGMQIVKQNGIPVGMEHVFTMPPVSLNFGTSGVSNIAISNRFKLLAYPDFIISDRFNLSRPELPFIFSIFIIGGTGYMQIDAEYRPFDKRLSVLVEAAAGGSAALAFSIGPVSGGVYIALSVALSYRKVIGAPGGGLSVAVVLVIAGNVSLWGMVTILLTLMLRMNYRDDGRIDGLGSLSAEVRISRFFKLKFRTQVTYQLREGRATRTVTSSTDTEIDPELKKKADRLKALRRK